MSKHTIKGFVTYERGHWEKTGCIGFQTWAVDPRYQENTVLVGEHEFEVEIPDDFNPVPMQVAALEEQKRLKRIKLAEELAAIDLRISKLTCLTNEVTT